MSADQVVTSKALADGIIGYVGRRSPHGEPLARPVYIRNDGLWCLVDGTPVPISEGMYQSETAAVASVERRKR